MIRLLKYEFRKALTGLLVLLGITAALEVWFLGGLAMDEESHCVIAAVLLFFCAYAVAIYVLVRGVTSYSGELKSRSSYLIFMTPNSCLKIVGSKFLYTFVNAMLFFVLYGVLAAVDVALMMDYYGELESFWTMVSGFLNANGVYVDQIGLGVLSLLIYAFLSILSTIAIAYLAITLSHTLFHERKWRWMPSLALFCLMSWGVSKINSLLPSATDHLAMVENTYAVAGKEAEIVIAAGFSDLIPYLLPSAGVSLAVILISLFGCAALLEKKVSL